ncbi:hypothetical protein D3C85_1720190 [compost metagenome]
MKNCEVAECGSLVRAMAMLPITFFRPLSASLAIGARVGFCDSAPPSMVKPPPWIMKPSITRWNTVLS